MSEERMVELVQGALSEMGVEDQVRAAGEFLPRGHIGSLFAGGIVGGAAGDVLGGVGDAIGTVGGSVAGARMHDASTGLPERMLVGVTDKGVYGFAEHSRRKPPGALVFSVARDDLGVEVHQRVNVRVLELVHESSGSRIELEGGRVPVTHSHDVIRALTG